MPLAPLLRTGWCGDPRAAPAPGSRRPARGPSRDRRPGPGTPGAALPTAGRTRRRPGGGHVLRPAQQLAGDQVGGLLVREVPARRRAAATRTRPRRTGPSPGAVRGSTQESSAPCSCSVGAVTGSTASARTGSRPGAAGTDHPAEVLQGQACAVLGCGIAFPVAPRRLVVVRCAASRARPPFEQLPRYATPLAGQPRLGQPRGLEPPQHVTGSRPPAGRAGRVTAPPAAGAGAGAQDRSCLRTTGGAEVPTVQAQQRRRHKSCPHESDRSRLAERPDQAGQLRRAMW
jgi:hypothetical protein